LRLTSDFVVDIQIFLFLSNFSDPTLSIAREINLVFVMWGMTHNFSAMVSTGIKSSELSIKHIAKTFYFVLSFRRNRC